MVVREMGTCKEVHFIHDFQKAAGLLVRRQTISMYRDDATVEVINIRASKRRTEVWMTVVDKLAKVRKVVAIHKKVGSRVQEIAEIGKRKDGKLGVEMNLFVDRYVERMKELREPRVVEHEVILGWETRSGIIHAETDGSMTEVLGSFIGIEEFLGIF